MPYEMTKQQQERLAQMYVKLFGGTLAEAQNGVNAHINGLKEAYENYSRMYGSGVNQQKEAEDSEKRGSLMGAEELKKAAHDNIEGAQKVFNDIYGKFCKEQLKTAWDRNLNLRLRGGDDVDMSRNSIQVFEEFSDYMTAIKVVFAQSGLKYMANGESSVLGNALGKETATREIVKGFKTQYIEVEVAPSWIKEWQDDALNNLPENAIEKAQGDIFKLDDQGEEREVADSMAEVTTKVNNICEKVSSFVGEDEDKSRKKQLIEAIAALRAVEQKHASRGFWWKLGHFFGDRRRENNAIEQMKNAINQTFSREEIDSLTDEDFRIAWIDEERSGGSPQQIAQAKEKNLDGINKDLEEVNKEIKEIEKDINLSKDSKKLLLKDKQSMRRGLLVEANLNSKEEFLRHNNALPHNEINEMKLDPFESDDVTNQRVAAEKEEMAKENARLEEYAKGLEKINKEFEGKYDTEEYAKKIKNYEEETIKKEKEEIKQKEIKQKVDTELNKIKDFNEGLKEQQFQRKLENVDIEKEIRDSRFMRSNPDIEDIAFLQQMDKEMGAEFGYGDKIKGGWDQGQDNFMEGEQENIFVPEAEDKKDEPVSEKVEYKDPPSKQPNP